MVFLAILGVPLIFIGGCMTTLGLMRSAGHIFVSGYGPKLPTGSRAYRQHVDPQIRARRIKLGLKLCAIGAVLVAIASF